MLLYSFRLIQCISCNFIWSKKLEVLLSEFHTRLFIYLQPGTPECCIHHYSHLLPKASCLRSPYTLLHHSHEDQWKYHDLPILWNMRRRSSIHHHQGELWTHRLQDHIWGSVIKYCLLRNTNISKMKCIPMTVSQAKGYPAIFQRKHKFPGTAGVRCLINLHWLLFTRMSNF